MHTVVVAAAAVVVVVFSFSSCSFSSSYLLVNTVLTFLLFRIRRLS
jgi:hypothetical protein